MHVSARAAAAAILYAGSAAGMGFTVFTIGRLRSFARNMGRPQQPFAPALTVLKPLHGSEPALYEHLRSFCDQQYAGFRIVFGAADANDPALEAVRRLQREFPALDIVIAAGSPGPARNPKVANLLGMEPHIQGELVVIADSDICVPRDYLARLAPLFADAGTGAATCIFAGIPNASAASRTGAMAITDEFTPSVLAAAALGPVDFCMGATIALRRSVLAETGGFAAIADALADDYAIAQAVVRAGHRIALAPFPVATAVPERRFAQIWAHEVRWARTILRARPAGYAGTIVLHYPVLAAAAGAIAGFPLPALAWFGAALGIRTWLHFEAQRIMAPRVGTAAHLLPVRIVLSFGVWCAAFTGRRVGWRGAHYEVNAKGRLVEGPGAV
ncbi:MAG: bacteriohopanetetrol glucosamine biosynthesis glycosyltransferase HpnI [Candidatus Baltobacteraceae bacterium]